MANFNTQRFEHHKETQNTMKINVKVQFPLQINMLPYTTRARNMNKSNDVGLGMADNFELARSCTYDLVSVVVHAGTIDTGKFLVFFFYSGLVTLSMFEFCENKSRL